MRHEIDLLLLELWQDTRCRACIKAQACTPGGVFGGFVSSVLNDLMYLFKDSLERLADIKQIEDSRRDTQVWSALSDEARKDKETFYAGQQRAASGFMSYAKTTLDLLITLTGDKDIGGAFMQQPLLGLTAFAALHFMELLVGPRCQALDVDKPQRYNFDKHALLLTLVQLTGQLAQHRAFPEALSEEPDYEDSLLTSAVTLLNKQHAYAAADTLSGVLASVAKTPARQLKKQRMSPQEPGSSTAAGFSTAAGAGAAAGFSGGGIPSGPALDAHIEGLVAKWSQGLGGSAATFEGAEQAYVQALEPLSVGVFDANAPGAYNSQFRELASRQEGDTHTKLKRLGRELRDLQGKTKLPVGAAAACFVCQDADRPDKVRCIISGPQDTPYEMGLFVFDVYFPEGYPNVPPLMVLETTGEGRARFNPNLYADGKVCLSLLGTWHGGDEASKWNPSSSSLFQILLSIQGMIFVEDPYFNEPNVELMRGTTEGNITSMRYNSEVRLSTLRWAVLTHLRKPPPGLEETVRAHFRVLRGVLAARAGRWLREAALSDSGGGATFYRMVTVMDQIMEAAADL